MTSWKRDLASGLIVLAPILVTIYVFVWLYGFLASIAPGFIVTEELIESLRLPGDPDPAILAEVVGVVLSLIVFVVLVLAVGYLMRTTLGDVAERLIDNAANRMPLVRVVYNASKMAAETALGEQDSLQTPVKLETWHGLRMTAFKTGRMTDDGREILFLPTSPNITSGFVIEVEPERIEELDETVEEALTRVLSAGFGDSDRDGMGKGVPIDVIEDD